MFKFDEHLIFFTYKPYTPKFDISDIDEDEDNPIFMAVEGDEYIEASDDTIIKAAINLSSKYQRDGGMIVIIDKTSFEDNLVKIIVPFHNTCGNAYICYRNNLHCVLSIAIGHNEEHIDGKHVRIEDVAGYLQWNLKGDLECVEVRTNISNLF